MSGPAPAFSRRGLRVSPRRIAEWGATTLIVAGIVMMVQPLWLALFSYSFAVMLAGTILFVFGSKLPG